MSGCPVSTAASTATVAALSMTGTSNVASSTGRRTEPGGRRTAVGPCRRTPSLSRDAASSSVPSRAPRAGRGCGGAEARGARTPGRGRRGGRRSARRRATASGTRTAANASGGPTVSDAIAPDAAINASYSSRGIWLVSHARPHSSHVQRSPSGTRPTRPQSHVIAIPAATHPGRVYVRSPERHRCCPQRKCALSRPRGC